MTDLKERYLSIQLKSFSYNVHLALSFGEKSFKVLYNNCILLFSLFYKKCKEFSKITDLSRGGGGGEGGQKSIFPFLL